MYVVRLIANILALHGAFYLSNNYTHEYCVCGLLSLVGLALLVVILF